MKARVVVNAQNMRVGYVGRIEHLADRLGRLLRKRVCDAPPAGALPRACACAFMSTSCSITITKCTHLHNIVTQLPALTLTLHSGLYLFISIY